MLKSTVSDLMDNMGGCLYTGRVDIRGMDVCYLWKFGEAFGVSRYRNDILRAVCAAKEKMLSYHSSLLSISGVHSVSLKKCWDRTDFTADASGSYHYSLEQSTVYLGNKQMLKLIIDLIILWGQKMQELGASFKRVKMSQLLPPWKAELNEKYLVDEDVLANSSSDVEMKYESEDDTEHRTKDGDETMEDKIKIGDEEET